MKTNAILILSALVAGLAAAPVLGCGGYLPGYLAPLKSEKRAELLGRLASIKTTEEALGERPYSGTDEEKAEWNKREKEYQAQNPWKQVQTMRCGAVQLGCGHAIPKGQHVSFRRPDGASLGFDSATWHNLMEHGFVPGDDPGLEEKIIAFLEFK